MPYSFTAGASQTGAELAISIYDQVNSTFMDVKYADLLWRDIIGDDQVKTDINPGAQNYVQPIRDQVGAAQFMGKGASPRNIPSVSVSLGALTIPMAWSATSAAITNEDARVYEHGNLGSLAQDLGKVQRKACENLIETSVFFGAAEVGFEGFLSYTGVTASNVAATGTGFSTLWSAKTGSQIIDDVNAAIKKVMEDTKYIFNPGTIYLPPAQFFALQVPLVVGGVAVATSILEWIKKNNAYTAWTGNELTIKPIRYLAGAGANGTNRMVVMEKSAEYQYLPFPMPFKLGAPVPEALGASFYAEQKFGSYAVIHKGSMQYFDGI